MLLLGGSATVALGQPAGPGFGAVPNASGPPAMTIPGQYSQQIVRPSQYTGLSIDEDEYKPLPSQISAMPEVEEELEVIRRRSQLVITRSNITRIAIADPTVLDVVQYSPTEISIIGIQRGATTVTLWFENNPDPLIYLVKIIPDPNVDEQRRIDYGKLERRIALLFPDSKVYLIPMSRKLIVKGQARDNQEAAQILNLVRGESVNQFGDLNGPQPGFGGGGGFGRPFGGFGNGFGANDLNSGFIVNMLEVPGEQQVMLRVQIAELSRSQLRQMGVDITYLLNNGRHVLGTALGGAGGALSGVFEQGELSVLVNWLATNGTAKILAEPTVTVLSGHPASFLSGGEFAVPTIVGIGGAQGQQTTFRGFGTSLFVTPTIIDRDLIRMNITPEFSSIDVTNAVAGIPGLNSNRVQTTVQLREGQTLALAGLFSRQQSANISRVPYLSSIPKIGPTLFSNKTAAEDEKELLILVSPEIIRPMDAEEVPPVPGHYVTHPTDEQLYFHQMLEGPADRGVYQLAPYGAGTGQGVEVGYRYHNPEPASAMMPPSANQGFSSGAMMPGQGGMGYGVPASPMMPTMPMYQSAPVYQSAPTYPSGPVYQSAPSYSTPAYSTPMPSYSQPMQSHPVGPSMPSTPIYPAAPTYSQPTYPQPTPAPPASGLGAPSGPTPVPGAGGLTPTPALPAPGGPGFGPTT